MRARSMTTSAHLLANAGAEPEKPWPRKNYQGALWDWSRRCASEAPKRAAFAAQLSAAESSATSPARQQILIKQLGVPECPHCASPKLTPMRFGFKCRVCGDLLGFDLKRLKESPVNLL